jgi:hypothetical protein
LPVVLQEVMQTLLKWEASAMPLGSVISIGKDKDRILLTYDEEAQRRKWVNYSESAVKKLKNLLRLALGETPGRRGICHLTSRYRSLLHRLIKNFTSTT